MSEDPIHRAVRWQSFYHEDGGLKEVLDGLRFAYFERYSKVNDPSQKERLSIAGDVVKEIQSHMQAIFDAGKIQMANEDHAARVAKLPAARRRFL